MCERSYPKKLAFQYLEDLKSEFERVNGSQIETAARPYAFIKFGKILVPCGYFRFSDSCNDTDFHLFEIYGNWSCLKIHLFKRQRNCTRTQEHSAISQS